MVSSPSPPVAAAVFSAVSSVLVRMVASSRATVSPLEVARHSPFGLRGLQQVSLSICLSVYLPHFMYRSDCLSACLCVCLSVCLSVGTTNTRPTDRTPPNAYVGSWGPSAGLTTRGAPPSWRSAELAVAALDAEGAGTKAEGRNRLRI